MKFIFAIYTLAAASAFAGDLFFSMMENGDRVEITERSKGCFHNTLRYYEVRRNQDTYSFTEYSITWKNSGALRTAEKKVTGEIIAPPKDIKDLDGLLEFYRKPKTASSTTQTSLVLEYYEGTRRIQTESLRDGSGGWAFAGIDFSNLALRFKKQPSGQ